MSSTKINLGKVALTPKGEWNAATTYERLDVVSYQGSSYTVLKECTGRTPSEGEYYSLLASKGAKGDKGDSADPVVASFNGRTGPVVPQEGDYTPEMIGTLSKDAINKLLQRKSNKNLLHNWYLKKAINQRGITSYNPVYPYTHTIDRWGLAHTRWQRMDISSDGVKISPLTDDKYPSDGSVAWGMHPTGINQLLDNPQQYAGKTLTFSAIVSKHIGTNLPNVLIGYYDKDESDTDVDWTIHWNGTGDNYIRTRITDASGNMLISVTYTIPSNVTVKKVCAELRGPDTRKDGTTHNDYDIFSAAKLEEGTEQTLVHLDENGNFVLNDVFDEGEELRKCQRYYWKMKGEWSPIGTGVVISSKILHVQLTPPAAFRCTPAIKFNKLYLNGSGAVSTEAIPVTNVTLGNSEDNSVLLNISINKDLTLGTSYFISTRYEDDGYIEFDANL